MEQRCPQRVEIASLVRRLSFCQERFRSRVRHRPNERPRLRQRVPLQPPCDAEVQHLDVAIGRDAQVFWLDIAVDQRLVVRLVQRERNLSSQLQRLGSGQRTLGEHLLDGHALHQLHDEEVRTPLLPVVEQSCRER